MTLYKVLLPGRVTPYAHMTWPVQPGEWTPARVPVMRESGWHLVTERGLSAHLRVGELWTTEGRGPCMEADDQVAYTSARLLERVATVSLEQIVQLAHDYAQHVAHLRDTEAAAPAAAHAHAHARAAAYAAAYAAYAANYAHARAVAVAADAADNAAHAAANYAHARAPAYAADADAERQWQHDRILEVVTL